MKRNLFFALSALAVGLSHAASPVAVTAVKKEVTECKCDAKCNAATCACPKCPAKETAKVKEAAAQIIAEAIKANT